jgi:hypothetical protein
MKHYQTRSLIGWRRHILLTLISQLLVLKLIRKFSTKTDIPLEITAAPEPIETREFFDPIVAHLENRLIESNSVQTVAKAPASFMTIAVLLKWINIYLIKNISVLKSIAFEIKIMPNRSAVTQGGELNKSCSNLATITKKFGKA